MQIIGMQRRLAFKPSSFGASLLKETDTVIVCEIVVVKTFQQLPFPPIIWNKFFEKERRERRQFFLYLFLGLSFEIFVFVVILGYLNIVAIICNTYGSDIDWSVWTSRVANFGSETLMRCWWEWIGNIHLFITHLSGISYHQKLSLFICIYFYAFFEVSFKK